MPAADSNRSGRLRFGDPGPSGKAGTAISRGGDGVEAGLGNFAAGLSPLALIDSPASRRKADTHPVPLSACHPPSLSVPA